MITVMLTDLFDSLSTFIGVAQAANLVDEQGRTDATFAQGLIVDACATLGAGLFGTSSGTAYVESIAGIRMGGRTGLHRGRHGALLPALPVHRADRRGDSALCDRRRC